MKSLSKEGIEVLKTNPKWFEDGYHGKTGEVIDKEEFVYRIKALRSIGKAKTLSSLKKHQGRTPVFKLSLSAVKVYKVHADCTLDALYELISKGRLQTVTSANGNLKLSNEPLPKVGVQIYLLP